MKFAFIAKYQQEYPVSLLCRVLEVSVSGYYAWKQRAPSQRQREDERLSLRIQQVHHASHQIYGSRRIRAELAAHGQSCGRKRVVRLMRKLGICSKPRRHRSRTTDSQHNDPVAANLLAREFTTESPNTKWVTDITGVWTRDRLALSSDRPRFVLTHDRRLEHGTTSRQRVGRTGEAVGVGPSTSWIWPALSF